MVWKRFDDCKECNGSGCYYSYHKAFDGHRTETVGWTQCPTCDRRYDRVVTEALSNEQSRAETTNQERHQEAHEPGPQHVEPAFY